MSTTSEGATVLIRGAGGVPQVRAPRFTLEVLRGSDVGARAAAREGRLTVGTADGADLVLTDPTVSRYHAELVASERGLVLRDLGSTNGTLVAGVEVGEVVLRKDAEIKLGKTKVRLRLGGDHEEVQASPSGSFGRLLGGSAQMRHVYTLLERAAPTTAPVLITGESGTGKELAARAVHDASDRRDGPFEVVDCGGLPPSLIEGELFGHDKGAFTHATGSRAGAFERADGGTIFLDELGELPLELQPKLLRALGEGQIRRLGGSEIRQVDVRVVAATNRDLRREVNAGTFRSDLFFRLAVIQVHLPPLRERLDDLPALVPALLERVAERRGVTSDVECDETLLASLRQHRWPGNVRELSNYLEQLVILRIAPALPGAIEAASLGGAPSPTFEGLEDLPLRTAKQQIVERFERHYVTALLDATGGNVAEAARRAGVDRGTLFRTLRRYGIER
ncbi:MAG: sigma 54-interacting transcriptional regulator [Polyangiaceae bacterium]